MHKVIILIAIAIVQSGSGSKVLPQFSIDLPKLLKIKKQKPETGETERSKNTAAEYVAVKTSSDKLIYEPQRPTGMSVPLTLVFNTGGQANAQTLKRISFSRGRNSVVVKGLTGDYGVTYVIRARSGQKLVLELTPASKVGIKVETEGRFGQMVLLREEGGGNYEVGIEESGDYTIFVGPLGRDPVPFTLTVKMKKLADI